METITEKVSPFAAPFEISADPAFTSYQIQFLLQEIEYLQILLQEIEYLQKHQKKPGFGSRFLRKLLNPRQIAFLHLQFMQIYWTVTRILGLAHLHDGTRTKPSRPILDVDHIKLEPGPRIFIDVTATYRNDAKTGIQRVVREVSRASIASGGAIPVIIENGRLLSYYRHSDLPDVIKISAGDRLLMLDVCWAYPKDYLSILREVARCGGSNIWGVYDLIPLLYPGLVGSSSNDSFRRWFEMSLPHYDAVVTISKSVAEDFRQYVSTRKLQHKPSLRLGWFHLGADFAAETEGPPSPQVRNVCGAAPFFLTVGTLEPRKNHITMLAAFEHLWNAGIDVGLIIVGKCGWLANALRSRLQEHPEFGRRLFWFENCGDTDLHYLYRHATAVIQASIAEGFGLPIIEAAHFGAPVIASDIRVFHEVGGSSLAYFDATDPEALAKCVKDALAKPRTAPDIASLSWKEATQNLLQLVAEEKYGYSFSQSD